MAKKIFETTNGLPGGQLNDKNIYAGMCSPMDWAYITDSAFYVGKRQSEGFQFIDRMSPVVRFFRDNDNEGYKATYVTRFGVWLKERPWTRGGGTSAA